jgi:hypothetical protein
MATATGTKKRRLLFADEDDDADNVPQSSKAPPPPPPKPVKVSRLFGRDEDDDDETDNKPKVVAKRPPLKKARTVPSAKEKEVPTETFLKELEVKKMPVSMSALVAQLPADIVIPSERPMAPVASNPSGVKKSNSSSSSSSSSKSHGNNLATELEEIQKSLSAEAREYLNVMLSLNPQIKRRKRDPATGHTIPHIPETQVKGASRPVLRINTYQFEQQLLYFATERESPLRSGFKFKPRACLNGEKCIANASSHLPLRYTVVLTDGSAYVVEPPESITFTPGPLMQFYTPQQLHELYTTGVSPVENTYCLRCMRYVFCDLALYAQGTAESWGPSSVIQSFANTIGGQTGYARDVCLMPSTNGVYNGLVQPLVQDRDSRLFVNWDPITKGFFVDQRGLASPEIVFTEAYPRDIWRQLRLQASIEAEENRQLFQLGVV